MYENQSEILAWRLYRPLLRATNRVILDAWDQIALASFGVETPEMVEVKFPSKESTIPSGQSKNCNPPWSWNKGASARHRYRESFGLNNGQQISARKPDLPPVSSPPPAACSTKLSRKSAVSLHTSGIGFDRQTIGSFQTRNAGERRRLRVNETDVSRLITLRKKYEIIQCLNLWFKSQPLPVTREFVRPRPPLIPLSRPQTPMSQPNNSTPQNKVFNSSRSNGSRKVYNQTLGRPNSLNELRSFSSWNPPIPKSAFAKMGSLLIGLERMRCLRIGLSAFQEQMTASPYSNFSPVSTSSVSASTEFQKSPDAKPRPILDSLKASILLDKITYKLGTVVSTKKWWRIWVERKSELVKTKNMIRLIEKLRNRRIRYGFVLLQLSAEERKFVETRQQFFGSFQKLLPGILEYLKNQTGGKSDEITPRNLLTVNYCLLNGAYGNEMVLPEELQAKQEDSNQKEPGNKIAFSVAEEMARSRPESALDIPSEEECNIPWKTSDVVKPPKLPKILELDEIAEHFAKMSVGKLILGIRLWLYDGTSEIDCVLKLASTELIWEPFNGKHQPKIDSHNFSKQLVKQWLVKYAEQHSNRENTSDSKRDSRSQKPETNRRRYRFRSNPRKSESQCEFSDNRISLHHSKRPLYSWRHSCRETRGSHTRLLLPIEREPGVIQFLGISADSSRDVMSLMASLTTLLSFMSVFKMSSEDGKIAELLPALDPTVQKSTTSPVLLKIQQWDDFVSWTKEEKMKLLCRLIRRRIRGEKYQII